MPGFTFPVPVITPAAPFSSAMDKNISDPGNILICGHFSIIWDVLSQSPELSLYPTIFLGNFSESISTKSTPS